jgi:TetR/AcrR family transcriptional regulator, transcriptional repressor for nem operon
MPGIRPVEFDTDKAVDDAVESFWTHGYGNATLPRLLEDLGIARQSLYNTFGDKHALFLRALDRYSERRIAEHTRSLSKTDRPLDDMISFVDGWRDRRRKTKGRGCLICLAMSEIGEQDAEVAKRLASHTQRFVAIIADCLERAIKAKQAMKHDPRSVASSLVAMSFGIATLARLSGCKAELDFATDSAVQMLRRLEKS